MFKRFRVLTAVLTLVGVMAGSTFGYITMVNAGAAVNYQYGLTSVTENKSESTALLKSEWEDWKNACVTSSGAGGYLRVQRSSADSYDTVSEGIGYGMLLATYFNEQNLFDQIYGYAKTKFNSHGLMNWRIDANGSVIGANAATDADEDMALALVFASKKWNSGKYNYLSEAKTMINNIYTYEVEPGTYVLKPGDVWGGSDCTNPSYFAPGWYRIFASVTGNQNWIKVADKCYEIVGKTANNTTGLVPDWCTANGTNSGNGFDYKYDACRYAWRAAVDYSWFGTAAAKDSCDKLANFFKGIGVTNVKDGYTVSGTPIGQWHSASFVSTAACSAMTGSDTAYTRSFYNETIKVKDSGGYYYYGNSIRLLTLVYLTGNFTNLYAGATSTIIPHSPTVTPAITATMPSESTPVKTPSPTGSPIENTAYAVSYKVQNSWDRGATINVTIKNNSSSAINGWTLEWTFPGDQKILDMWSATLSQNSTSILARNVSYNANIPANGMTTFGFNISSSSITSVPVGFTLNGIPCQVN